MVLMNLFAGQQWGQRHREQILWTQWVELRGGTDLETNMETHTLPYVKQIASGNLLYDVGSSHAL